MKKTLALLLCVAMLFTALSVNVFADVTPTVEIVTHEASVEIDEKTGKTSTDFAISLANFDSLKGFDLVITADEGVEFESASAIDTKASHAADKNYVISEDKHTLHIVELTAKDAGAIITVKANVVAAAAYTIKVTACDLAKSGEELYAKTEYTINKGAIVPYVAPVHEVKEEATTVTQPTTEEGYFIPYGSVYTGSADAPFYVEKKQDGSFVVPANTNVTKFKLPESGFGTFGVSNSVVSSKPAKQFGNIATNYTVNKKYGSLVIVGDWAGFRDWYLTNKAYSDAELVEKIYAAFESVNAEVNGEREFDFVSFKAGESAIKVYNVAQKNWMWKNAAKGILEYAVRVFGLEANTEYAAVAYNIDGSTVNFSKEIKAEVFSAQ